MLQERFSQLLKQEKPLLGPVSAETINLSWLLEIHSSSLQTGVYTPQSLKDTSYIPMIDGKLFGSFQENFDMLSFYRTNRNILIHTFRISEALEIPLHRGNSLWINLESLSFNIKEFFRKIKDFETTGFIEVEDRIKKERGFIFLQGGQVVSAVLGRESGETALKELLRSLSENSCLLNIYELSDIVLSFLLSDYKLIFVLYELGDAEEFVINITKSYKDSPALLVSVSMQEYGYRMYMDGNPIYMEAFKDDAPVFEVYLAKSFKTLDFLRPEDYLPEDSKMRVVRSDDGSPIVYFCPACWSVISEKDLVCPNCGYDLAEFHKIPYEYKILMALEHPVVEMRINVIHVVGMKNLKEALPQLEHMVNRESNPMILMAIVDALAKMTHPEALELLRKLSHHTYPLIRSRARYTLERFMRLKAL